MGPTSLPETDHAMWGFDVSLALLKKFILSGFGSDLIWARGIFGMCGSEEVGPPYRHNFRILLPMTVVVRDLECFGPLL